MEDVKKVLDKYDIAGLVIIHKPGFGEYYLKIDPTYSCAKYDAAGNIRIKAKQSDYNGNTVAKMKAISETANMFKVISDLSDLTSDMVKQISAFVDKETGAEHDEGEGSSHTTQNN